MSEYASHLEAKRLMKERNYIGALQIMKRISEEKAYNEYNAHFMFCLYADIEACAKQILDFETAYKYSSKRLSLIESFKSWSLSGLCNNALKKRRNLLCVSFFDNYIYYLIFFIENCWLIYDLMVYYIWRKLVLNDIFSFKSIILRKERFAFCKSGIRFG